MDERYDPNLILAYVEGELDDAGRERFDRQCAEDPGLRELADKLRADRAAVRALPDAQPSSSAAEAATAMMERQLLLGDAPLAEIGPGTAASSEPTASGFRLFRLVAYSGVAAAIALTGIVVVQTLTGTPLAERARNLAGPIADADSLAQSEAAEPQLAIADGEGADARAKTTVPSDPAAEAATTRARREGLAAETDTRDFSDASGELRTERLDDVALAMEDANTLDADAPAAVAMSGLDLGRAGDADAFGNMSADPTANRRLALTPQDESAGVALTEPRASGLGEQLRLLEQTEEQEARVLATRVLRAQRTAEPAEPLTLAVNVVDPPRHARAVADWVVSNGGTVIAVVDPEAAPARDAGRRASDAKAVAAGRFDEVAEAVSTQPTAQQLDVVVPSPQVAVFYRQLQQPTPALEAQLAAGTTAARTTTAAAAEPAAAASSLESSDAAPSSSSPPLLGAELREIDGVFAPALGDALPTFGLDERLNDRTVGQGHLDTQAATLADTLPREPTDADSAEVDAEFMFLSRGVAASRPVTAPRQWYAPYWMLPQTSNQAAIPELNEATVRIRVLVAPVEPDEPTP